MMSAEDFYMLHGRTDKSCVLRPLDVDYFQDHFTGRKMASGWKPENFEVAKKSLPVRDCIPWFLGAPVFSEKACEALAELLGDSVEFLPLTRAKSKELFAVNVLRSESCIARAERVGKNLRFPLVIDRERWSGAPMFKPTEDNTMVLVSRRFVDAVLSQKLTGFVFTRLDDPMWYLKPEEATGIVT